MKTEIEIEIKKIRMQLKKHTITEEEKSILRKKLQELKKLSKIEKLS